jgi:hypothetical protein
MRADTASITTPAKPERDFAVTTAIVPVTTAIAQSKKMKISLGIEKNVEKKTKEKTKKKRIKRKKHEQKKKNTKKKKTKKTLLLVISKMINRINK